LHPLDEFFGAEVTRLGDQPGGLPDFIHRLLDQLLAVRDHQRFERLQPVGERREDDRFTGPSGQNGKQPGVVAELFQQGGNALLLVGSKFHGGGAGGLVGVEG